MDFKTEQEILLSAIAKAQETHLISESDELVEKISKGEQTENQYMIDLATHSYTQSIFEQQIEDVYLGTDIATARGEQLDRFGNLFNVHRFPGLPAQLVLQLSLEIPETEDIVIPAGTIVDIDQLQVDPYITYTTDDTITLRAGMTSAEVTASSDWHALQRRVPADCVEGLRGFPLVQVSNPEPGSCGRSIEEDNEYRQRILLWPSINTKGTEESFDAYLGQVEGLDDYKLIPQPEGIGTLTVVCDCIESQLIPINEGIQNNCMLFTDDPVQTINPDMTTLDVQVTATVTRDPIQHTISELVELITAEIRTFIDGGNMRSGASYFGLHIGEDFIPSQLIMQLHNLFPELISITCDTLETSIDDRHKFQSGTIEVVIT